MNLELLPDEILLKIFDCNFVSLEDLFSLTKVCHRFHDTCSLQSLWKSRFQRGWPWVWKRIHATYATSQSTICWKKEVLAILSLSRKLDQRLNSLSYELYKYKNITSPVLATIFEFFNFGTYGPIYVLNELRAIVSNERDADFTKLYYTKLVLFEVHEFLCQEEFKEFFKLPSSKQSLEKGAYFFAKWFQPAAFLDINMHQICSKFDELAHEVQSHLRKKNAHHPASFHELFSPEEALESTKWSEEDCEGLFRSINYVLFTQNNFRGNGDYYVIQNSLLNKVMETKKGIPVTLSIIYKAVCHRLGILLHPVNCPSHFLLKWKVPNSNRIEFIDSFNKGIRMVEGSSKLNNLTTLNKFDCEGSTLEVLMRMANNTLYLHEFDLDTDMLSAAGILLLLEPENEDMLEFIYRLYLSYELHIDRMIWDCNELLKKKPSSKDQFKGLIKDAEILLAIQEKGPKPVTSKTRPTEVEVKFATGLVMCHKLYNYTCVIFGWDTVCKMPMEWIIQMNVLSLKFKHNQPFYNVLVSDGSHRYAAQENLLVMGNPVQVTHTEIGKYFKAFNGMSYVPNDELRSEYPEDDDVRVAQYVNI